MRHVCALGCGPGVRGALSAITIALLAVLVGAVPAAAAPNPEWPAQCPQRVVLVLDLSESIDPYLPEVKKSASDLVDALRGASNEVAVVTFGSYATLAAPLMNVGNEAERRQLKDLIYDVSLTFGDGGGTNWQAGLSEAAALNPGIVLFLTDGQPTVSGSPSSGYLDSEDSLSPAVQVADSMRGSGTRIVGLGMGLEPEYVPNLVQVTGPVPDDDYYQTGTDAHGLLDKLYDVASKTCGIPVAALPQPEGGEFPVLPVIGAVVAAVLLAVLGGFLKSRPKSDPASPPSVRRKTEKLKDPSIRLSDLPPIAPNVTRMLEEEAAVRDADTEEPPDRKPRPPVRRMSLSRLHEAMDAQPPTGPKTGDESGQGSAGNRP